MRKNHQRNCRNNFYTNFWLKYKKKLQKKINQIAFSSEIYLEILFWKFLLLFFRFLFQKSSENVFLNFCSISLEFFFQQNSFIRGKHFWQFPWEMIRFFKLAIFFTCFANKSLYKNWFGNFFYNLFFWKVHSTPKQSSSATNLNFFRLFFGNFTSSFLEILSRILLKIFGNFSLDAIRLFFFQKLAILSVIPSQITLAFSIAFYRIS